MDGSIRRFLATIVRKTLERHLATGFMKDPGSKDWRHRELRSIT